MLIAQRPEIYIGPIGNQRLLTNFVDSWGKLEITDRWPGGSWQATWDMPLQPWQRYSWLQEDALVQIRVGPVSRFWGTLAKPDWNTSQFVAVGLVRQGEGAISLDATGKTNSVPDTVIDQGIARGVLDWVKPVSLSPFSFGGTTETDRFNYITALMDAFAAGNGIRWFVDLERAVRVNVDPVTPTAFITMDTGVLGVSDQRKAGTVFGRFRSATSGLIESARWPTTGGARPEVGADWTPVGAITLVQATSLCQSAWTQLQGGNGWTNGIQVGEGELVAMGGTDKALWNYRAGQMTRILGLRDERNRLLGNTDVVIGESIWRVWESTLQLNPVGMDGLDPGSVIQSLGGNRL